MADTYIDTPNGAGTKVHTFSRTVAAQTVHEEVLQPGFAGHGTVLGANIGLFSVGDSEIDYDIGVPYAAGSLFVPHPYYCYITRVTAQQSKLAASASVVKLELRIGTDGKSDCRWPADGTLPANFYSLYRADTTDPVGIEVGSAQDTWGSTFGAGNVVRTFGTLATLSLPLAASGPLTRAHSAAWAPGKPVRFGPGPALKLLLIVNSVSPSSPAETAKFIVNYEGYVATY